MLVHAVYRFIEIAFSLILRFWLAGWLAFVFFLLGHFPPSLANDGIRRAFVQESFPFGSANRKLGALSVVKLAVVPEKIKLP